jgi:predicted RNA-binding protein YlxR (DUF448 family)
MMMDATGRLAGRGAYLCVDPACRRTALSKNILTRALGVPLPEALRSELDAGSTPALRSGVLPGAESTQTHTNTPGGTIGQE